MRPYVQALAARKLAAEAIDLPRSGRSVVKAEKAVPVFIEKVPAGSIAGGHSYGGRIACPVLLLSGESDPFARLELLRASVRLLPQAELVTFPGVGHGLLPVVDA